MTFFRGCGWKPKLRRARCWIGSSASGFLKERKGVTLEMWPKSRQELNNCSSLCSAKGLWVGHSQRREVPFCELGLLEAHGESSCQPLNWLQNARLRRKSPLWLACNTREGKDLPTQRSYRESYQRSTHPSKNPPIHAQMAMLLTGFGHPSPRSFRGGAAHLGAGRAWDLVRWAQHAAGATSFIRHDAARTERIRTAGQLARKGTTSVARWSLHQNLFLFRGTAQLGVPAQSLSPVHGERIPWPCAFTSVGFPGGREANKSSHSEVL